MVKRTGVGYRALHTDALCSVREEKLVCNVKQLPRNWFDLERNPLIGSDLNHGAASQPRKVRAVYRWRDDGAVL